MTRMKNWLIYGANGYSGKMVSRYAKAYGLNPVLAGRNGDAVRALGDELGLPTMCFDLDDYRHVCHELKDIHVVLNCAGPMAQTCQPLLECCLQAKTHYLDISGEIGVFNYCYNHRDSIRIAGSVVVPGIGFEVMLSDTIANILKQQMPDAVMLQMGFAQARQGQLSRGTVETLYQILLGGGRVISDSHLVNVGRAYKTLDIPFLDTIRKAVTIPSGDLFSSWYSSKIPNIEYYAAVSEQGLRQLNFLQKLGWMLKDKDIKKLLYWLLTRQHRNPTAGERYANNAFFWGEVINDNGEMKSIRVKTPDPYSFTADAAVKAVEKFMELAGTKAGLYTPTMLLGTDFLETLKNVEIEMIGQGDAVD